MRYADLLMVGVWAINSSAISAVGPVFNGVAPSFSINASAFNLSFGNSSGAVYLNATPTSFSIGNTTTNVLFNANSTNTEILITTAATQYITVFPSAITINTTATAAVLTMNSILVNIAANGTQWCGLTSNHQAWTLLSSSNVTSNTASVTLSWTANGYDIVMVAAEWVFAAANVANVVVQNSSATVMLVKPASSANHILLAFIEPGVQSERASMATWGSSTGAAITNTATTGVSGVQKIIFAANAPAVNITKGIFTAWGMGNTTVH